MGLMVRAYSEIEFLAKVPDIGTWDRYFNRLDTFYVWPGYILSPEFPEQVKGAGLVQGGVYIFSEMTKFDAGGYTHYNWWKYNLSNLMIGVSSETVIENPAKFQDKPFYFLINFSDSGGIISRSSAEKLLKDFDENVGKCANHPAYWRETYNNFRHAFYLAANNGLVIFD